MFSMASNVSQKIMTTTTNTENLRQYKQYKTRFSLTVEQMLIFTSSMYLVREVENLSPNFKRIA